MYGGEDEDEVMGREKELTEKLIWFAWELRLAHGG